MKRVLQSEFLAEIGHFKNVLEQNDIPCVIKNEQLSGALGEVPFIECLPELWVVDDDDLDRAERLLSELRQDAASGKAWRCPRCGEDNEGQFAACWNCNSSRNEA
jgi:hypothetical protein